MCTDTAVGNAASAIVFDRRLLTSSIQISDKAMGWPRVNLDAFLICRIRKTCRAVFPC